MVVSKENLHQTAKLGGAIEDLPVRWDDSAGAVSIIGTGITASHEQVLQGSKALRELHVHCCGIATSSFRVTWLIERETTRGSRSLFSPDFYRRAPKSSQCLNFQPIAKKKKPARSEGEHVLGANRAGRKTIFGG